MKKGSDTGIHRSVIEKGERMDERTNCPHSPLPLKILQKVGRVRMIKKNISEKEGWFQDHEKTHEFIRFFSPNGEVRLLNEAQLFSQHSKYEF